MPEPDVQPRTDPRPARDPLVIRDLKFLGGMAAAGGWRPPPSLPEVAFSGRSNVGKSSLLNTLVRRKKLARVSNTPGRTREINFFQVNEDFVLVDLPGYGYARISKERRAEWKPLIDGYVRGSEQLRGIVQLLDIRREPNDDDLRLFDYLAELEIPTVAAVTKIDKVPRREVGPRLAAIASAIGLEDAQMIPFSAVTGEGRGELAEAILSLIAQPSWRAP
jgi:GTP-binding protein